VDRKQEESMKGRKWLSVLVAFGLVAAACQQAAPNASPTGGGTGATTDRSNIRIVVVSHGQASDPFWSVVKNGVDQAAKDYGVKVEYQAPTGEFSPVEMAKLVDAAVASKPTGLVVSIPDKDALGPSITKAIDAGIPVISMNSGSDFYKELGVLVHVGQTEREAGQGGGERMAADGVKNAICFNQEVGNAALDLRCEGFTAGITAGGGKVKVVTGQISDPTGMTNAVLAEIQADPTIDGVLTLGPSAASPILEGLKAGGHLAKVKMGTFDLSPEVLRAIDAGDMLFAIDQQQYIQGYLPVVLHTLYEQYGTIPAGVLMTGPGFVTKENAAQVIDLSSKGIR
jgi:simple sugar transport system substrate-binding protein